jgi:hypothetical protein
MARTAENRQQPTGNGSARGNNPPGTQPNDVTAKIEDSRAHDPQNGIYLSQTNGNANAARNRLHIDNAHNQENHQRSAGHLETDASLSEDKLNKIPSNRSWVESPLSAMERPLPLDKRGASRLFQEPEHLCLCRTSRRSLNSLICDKKPVKKSNTMPPGFYISVDKNDKIHWHSDLEISLFEACSSETDSNKDSCLYKSETITDSHCIIEKATLLEDVDSCDMKRNKDNETMQSSAVLTNYKYENNEDNLVDGSTNSAGDVETIDVLVKEGYTCMHNDKTEQNNAADASNSHSNGNSVGQLHIEHLNVIVVDGENVGTNDDLTATSVTPPVRPSASTTALSVPEHQQRRSTTMTPHGHGHHMRQLRQWQSTKSSRRRALKRRQVEMQITRLVVIITLSFFFCWTPFAVVSLIGVFGDASVVTPLVSSLPQMLAKVGTVLNPLLYVLAHPKHRKTLVKRCVRLLAQARGDRQSRHVDYRVGKNSAASRSKRVLSSFYFATILRHTTSHTHNHGTAANGGGGSAGEEVNV